MSGILENVLAAVQANAAALARIEARLGAGQMTAAPAAVAATVAPVAAAADPFGLSAAAPVAAAAPVVDAAMLQALVQPLVVDPNAKAALLAELNAMGLANLPDAQPHQYGELYQRFSAIKARMAAPAATTAAPAII